MKNTAHYKKQLEHRLQELQSRLAHVEDRLDDPVDPDFSEQAVEREQDEVLEGLGESSEIEIRQVKDALRRIEAGTYGSCLECGGEISKERLEAVPHAALCRHCAN